MGSRVVDAMGLNARRFPCRRSPTKRHERRVHHRCANAHTREGCAMTRVGRAWIHLAYLRTLWYPGAMKQMCHSTAGHVSADAIRRCIEAQSTRD